MRDTKRVVLLTGAGASAPLGLPLMATFIGEPTLQSGGDLAQMVAHLGCAWARANTASIDFEFLYTLAHLLSDASSADPLAYALVPGAGTTVRWSVQGRGTGERVLNLDDVRVGAHELRERLRAHVHDQLWNFDHKKGAALYGGFLKPLMTRLGKGGELDIFTTNYDRVVEAIWEDGLHNDVFGFTTVLRRGFRTVNEYRPGMEWDSANYELAGNGDFVVRLFKLHGSLNWRSRDNRVSETNADEYSARESTLVYPLQGVKDCRKEPFATLFERWRRSVSTATDCIAVGASLRDPEVVLPIEDTANQSPDFRLWLVDPLAKAVKARLPEAIRARSVEVAALFGDDALGERLAEALFSTDRHLTTLDLSVQATQDAGPPTGS